jgi:hypothetical protein
MFSSNGCVDAKMPYPPAQIHPRFFFSLPDSKINSRPVADVAESADTSNPISLQRL